ncbi:peptidoglycan DD-metalloendopeptidase family protein [Lutimonas saemankumensis]|uniref:murein hydrolase activator EnvC family protein n=1 Tax=Lutimonas saemankumensis TaxID=483016 RepID=UPI001CD4061C|nr:peptidoglycan DD-metalloendopeptidase family protein [Lutimonas saemankumensis]MCA0933021.1 peptidoglycan DD-metalloendopeptidase family protein [Lutimonas saemankumensis]
MILKRVDIKENRKGKSYQFREFFGLNVIVVLFFLLIPVAAFSQTREELEKQRLQLQKEIKEINTLLFKSQKKEKTLLSDLSDIVQRIGVRTKLINTISEETEQLNFEIKENERQVKMLEDRLELLKKDYANMVVQSYKSKTKNSRLMFLLSSESFLQAFKRLEYIKQYAAYRERQGEEILAESIKLKNLNDYLVERRNEKEELLALNKKEKDSITKEKSTQESLVRSIKKKEKKYIAQINKKQKQEKMIDAKIEALIAEAIAKSKKESNLKSSGFALTPEAVALEKDFISNKGKLPSPVERGVIVRRYGKQSHPTLKGITIESNGVFYATEKNANARVIFDGKVLAIQVLPGKKKAVLVQHGNYISVYKNLDNVTVQKGDLVTTKQEIGKIHTDSTTGKTILAFVLFKEIHRQNPEEWVYKN